MFDPNEPGGLEPHEHNFELSMPFVCCVSEGGEYDDRSFAAGCQFGQLAATLANGHPLDGVSLPFYPELVAQVDLAAMQHGYSITTEAYDDRWVMVTFARVLLTDQTTEEQ